MALSDRTVRNIGIAGYLGAFLIVASLLLALFMRYYSVTAPAS